VTAILLFGMGSGIKALAQIAVRKPSRVIRPADLQQRAIFRAGD
jgi:hypothetical protein